MDQDVIDMISNTCQLHNWTFEQCGQEIHVSTAFTKAYIYKEAVMVSAFTTLNHLKERELLHNSVD